MQFKEKDYVYYGAGGICLIDSICEAPFEGAREGVLYYVMHTLSEPKQTIWNPVDNTRVLMRAVMTRAEAEAVLQKIKDLAPIAADNAKLLREKYVQATKSCDPTEWGRIVRTYEIRRRAADEHLLRVTEAERNFHDNALRLLSAEIAIACGITAKEAEDEIIHALVFS